MDESGSGQALAAYLYVLGLDDIALAWEYLRRNGDYQRAWCRRTRSDPGAWGLKAFENPDLDARRTEPIWISDPAAVHLVPIPEDATAPRLDLWACAPGCRLLHDGRCLRATLAASTPVRLGLCPHLGHGDCYAYRIPAGPAMREIRRAALGVIADHERPAVAAALLPARRSTLVSMRTLAVLDAQRAGASERDIGIQLFGADRIFAEWSAESALRAQVRHLLRRGGNLVSGGYRKLLATGDLRG